MATDAPSKPKGKGLNGKIGPVPVKVALFVVVALAVYLYLRHRAKAAPSSAGSESTPAATDSGLTNLPLPDSTGGGSSGSSGGGIDPISDSAPVPATVPFNFYFSSAPTDAGGGNTSSPTVANAVTATQPSSSYPVGPSVSTDFAPVSYTDTLAAAFNNLPPVTSGIGAGSGGGFNLGPTAPPPSPAPKKQSPPPPPPSGYSQKSNANLH